MGDGSRQLEATNGGVCYIETREPDSYAGEFGFAWSSSPHIDRATDRRIEVTFTLDAQRAAASGRSSTMVNPGAYSIASQRFSGDTGAVGITGIAYTWQFGGGLSASLSLEDAGFGTGGGRSAINLAGGSGPIGESDVTSAFGLDTVWPNNEGRQFFDPVFNLRLDQNWGFVGASFARPAGTGGVNTGPRGANNVSANSSPPARQQTPRLHPTPMRWRSSGGQVRVGLRVHYRQRFRTTGRQPGRAKGLQRGRHRLQHNRLGPFAIYGSGNNMGMSYLVDGIFNTNTSVYLTHNWSALAYFEHVWSRTSFTAAHWELTLGAER